MTVASTASRRPRRWPFVAIGLVLLITAIAAGILSLPPFVAKAAANGSPASTRARISDSFVNALPPGATPSPMCDAMARKRRHRPACARGVRIASTPAPHDLGRGLTDRNSKLWTSWSVVGARHRFYVSGDTGYSDHFAKIGERFGPFDLAFMKIGAYGPGAPWLDIHMSPEDAVRTHRDVRARRMFPVHWGTFNLAFHDWNEPVQRTLAAARASQVEMVTPRVGEWVDADRGFASVGWYLTGTAAAAGTQ